MVTKYSQKLNFSADDCNGSHFEPTGVSKSTGVRATTTVELGTNLKSVFCIGKGRDSVQNVHALHIRPRRNLVVHQSYYGR